MRASKWCLGGDSINQQLQLIFGLAEWVKRYDAQPIESAACVFGDELAKDLKADDVA